jgi:Sulfotransferase family
MKHYEHEATGPPKLGRLTRKGDNKYHDGVEFVRIQQLQSFAARHSSLRRVIKAKPFWIFMTLAAMAQILVFHSGSKKLVNPSLLKHTSTNESDATLPTIRNAGIAAPARTVIDDGLCRDLAGPTLEIRFHVDVKVVDHPSKLMISGTPKGGATLTSQLMLRKLGLLETAQEWKWIHAYRNKVFNLDPAHRSVRCQEVCHQQGWVCVQLIRSPIDRAVSAYLNVMSSPTSVFREEFKELHQSFADSHGGRYPTSPSVLKRASFADFVQALHLRSIQNLQSTFDDHFMLQAETDCTISQNVIPLPIETIQDSLVALKEMTGVELNATGLTSHHYKKRDINSTSTQDKKQTTVLEDLSKVPYRKLPRSPLYESFFQDPALNAILCRVYCPDFELYRQMCLYWSNHAELQGAHGIAEVCQKERERTVNLCGHSYGDTWS